MPRTPRLFLTLLVTFAGTAMALAQAQTPPLPPSVIVNGYWLTNTGSGYYTDNFGAMGTSGYLTVNSPLQVILKRGVEGYWSNPFIITPGYDVPGYYANGYWEGGYWTEGYWSDGSQNGGYYDENSNWIPTGTWINSEWYPGIWNPGMWVEGYHVDDVWSSSEWVTTQVIANGTYTRFVFQLDNAVTVIPADAAGNPWASTPNSGIPAIQVQSALWQFSAADQTSVYDYYLPPTGNGYLWVNSAYYGGYDPQLGAFSGTNSSGYFRDTSGSAVRLIPRNANGSFLALATPAYGPAKIWSNGLTYRILTWNATNGIDVYLLDGYGYVTISSAGVVAGAISGQYTNQAFLNTTAPTFAATAAGTPLPASAHPLFGPPSLNVTGEVWRYRGTKNNIDYYGGEKPGGVLTIDALNVVSYSDKNRSIANAPGYYAGGVFQNLPGVVRATALNGDPWTSLPANSSAPASVIVNGNVWFYSSTESAASGQLAYAGAQRGQTLWIDGNQATLSDPATGTYRVGAYINGKFTFTGSALTVRAGNAGGAPLQPDPGLGNVVSGDLDVTGNAFSLGSMQVLGTDTTNGFGLTFAPPVSDGPALLNFASMALSTEWLWSHAVDDGGSAQAAVMKLDKGNRLLIFSPVDNALPRIILDPAGRSRFTGPLRIQPHGDISMGEFIAEPAQ